VNKINLREATKEDWPAILDLHRKHQEAQGTSYELPYLFAPNIAVALVGVDESDKIHNCVYVESVAELRFVGYDARATAYSRREIDGLAYLLKLLGYRCLDCCVPRKLKKYIQKPLKRAGFEDRDKELVLFSRDLRDRNE
jgi:hypothetical protein